MRHSMSFSLCSQIVARACDVCTVASVALRAFLTRSTCPQREHHQPDWAQRYHHESHHCGAARDAWLQLNPRLAYFGLAPCPAYVAISRLPAKS